MLVCKAAVPRRRQLLQAADRGQLLGSIDGRDVGAHRQAGIVDQRAGEDGGLGDVASGGGRGGKLRADVVDVGHELAGVEPDEVQQSMAVEVDPDEGAGDAAFIAGEAAGIGGRFGRCAAGATLEEI